MQLEFSTIPPYLCAQRSIDSGSDPSGVAGMIENVVIQECCIMRSLGTC
jgi:hypothetical protein